MRDFVTDFEYSLRMLRRSRIFSITAVLQSE
jgi:hypothetical protein